MSGHRLGSAFPHEGFVRAALERNFESCEPVDAGFADLAFIDESGERWVIEAKGETSDTGLDFRTGLGQLLQGMSEPKTRYALAMPDTPRFERQRARVPGWVRVVLGLHWILVDEDGELVVLPPRH
jgi:hypothetical protein